MVRSTQTPRIRPSRILQHLLDHLTHQFRLRRILLGLPPGLPLPQDARLIRRAEALRWFPAPGRDDPAPAAEAHTLPRLLTPNLCQGTTCLLAVEFAFAPAHPTAVLVWERSTPFTPQEAAAAQEAALDLAWVLAAHAAQAPAHSLQGFARLARLFTQPLPKDEVWASLCREAQVLLQARRVLLLLPGAEGHLEITAASGPSPLPPLPTFDLSATQGDDRPFFMPRNPSKAEGAPLLAAPLVFQGHTYGLLVAEEATAPQATLLIRFLAGWAAAIQAHAQAQQASLSAQQRAQEAEERASTALQDMAHELRNALTYHLGYLGILLEERADRISPDERVLLETMENKIQRFRRLLDAMLASLGEIHLSPLPLDLRSIIRQAVQSARPIAETHRQRLLLHLPDELPLVAADPDRIAQVVDNLLSNAIKYSPRGSEIIVRVEAHPQGAQVAISDQGPGIPPEERERIFQRFYRLPRNTHTPGLGVGLHLAREIIRAHGGKIWVESRPGQGSTFVFLLPYFDPQGESPVGRA